ncbi:MAG TPA: hypothetical protein VFA62_01225 [Acidimicrobiia bacterium]|nr:hypothetical protein [Acidimicrobiia bacterium]
MADTVEDPMATGSSDKAVRAAPLRVGALADVFNLRIAFLLVSPPVFLGAYVLYRARDHLDADAAKIFEAVVRAMQQDEERAGT